MHSIVYIDCRVLVSAASKFPDLVCMGTFLLRKFKYRFNRTKRALKKEPKKGQRFLGPFLMLLNCPLAWHPFFGLPQFCASADLDGERGDGKLWYEIVRELRLN